MMEKPRKTGGQAIVCKTAKRAHPVFPQSRQDGIGRGATGTIISRSPRSKPRWRAITTPYKITTKASNQTKNASAGFATSRCDSESEGLSGLDGRQPGWGIEIRIVDGSARHTRHDFRLPVAIDRIEGVRTKRYSNTYSTGNR